MSCGIYKITNQINGHCYIGQSICIEKRWKQHIDIAKNNLNKTASIYLAMRKYGLENFSFEILEECSQQELDDKERYWIKFFNSYKDGYNATIGGQKNGFWYDIEETRKLWDEGKSTGEIRKILNLSPNTIQKHLTNYKDFSVHNSRSRSAKKCAETNSPNLIGDFCKKEVFQYSLSGEYIQSYESIACAERKNNLIEHSTIYLCCQNKCKYTYGYQWSYIKTDKRNPIILTKRLIKCVNTGEIFENVFQAMKWAHLKSKTGINYCCRGKQQTAGKHPVTGEKLKWESIEIEIN